MGTRRTLTRQPLQPRQLCRRPLSKPEILCLRGCQSAFWADGNPDSLGISYLYFCNDKGDTFRMPYTMKAEWQKPEPVPGGKPRN